MKKPLTHKEMSLKGGMTTLKRHGKKYFKDLVRIREEKRKLAKEQSGVTVDNSTGQSTA